MGVVYLGQSKQRRVAVKLIRPELAEDEAFLARFRQEVNAASRVNGSFTAEVIEANVEVSRPYMVTEFIPGPTLDEHLRDHGPLRGEALRAFAIALLEALSAIHKEGLVHRDLKPSNILLSEDGPRVIDFGVARAADLTSITATGLTLGTPAWMAPEQAQGEAAGSPADIFAWASIVAYAGTGELPFGEGSSDAMLYRVVHKEPRLENLDPAMLPFVKKAIGKRADSRPTAEELIGMMLGDMTVADFPEGARTLATSYVRDTWVLSRKDSEKLPRARGKLVRATLIGTLLLAATASAAAVYTLARSNDKDIPEQAATSRQPSVRSSPKNQNKNEQSNEDVVAERPPKGFALFNSAIDATTPWYNDVSDLLGAYDVENEAVLLNTWWALSDWCTQADHGSTGKCYDLGASYVKKYFDRDPRTINSKTWGNPGAIGALFDEAYAVTAGYLGIDTQSSETTRPGTTYLCEPSCTEANPEPTLETADLSLTGLGPLTLGMSVAEAIEATGHQINVGDLYQGCGKATIEGGPQGVNIWVWNADRIGLIEVTGGNVTTLSGIGIGDSEAEVFDTYASQIEKGEHPDPSSSDDSYLYYKPKDPEFKDYNLIFEVRSSLVARFAVGNGTVGFYEYCV